MGFADRVVAPGQALAAAQVLAAELSAVPQVCPRADRRSVYAGLARLSPMR
jgi:enoyl-CoA hydratase